MKARDQLNEEKKMRMEEQQAAEEKLELRREQSTAKVIKIPYFPQKERADFEELDETR